jgi:hypothetical protein
MRARGTEAGEIDGGGTAAAARAREPGMALDSALRVARKRVLRRRVAAAAAAWAWPGAALAAALAGLWLLRLLELPGAGEGPREGALSALLPLAVAPLLGAALAVWRFRPERLELAQLVDRALGSGELALSAAALESGAAPPSPLAGRVGAEAESALMGAGDSLRRALPLVLPRHARALPLALLAVAALLALPRVPPRPKPPPPPGDVRGEAARLESRKEQLERELGTELPEDIERDFDALVQAMKEGRIDAGEAGRRAEELRKKISELSRNGGKVDGGAGNGRAAEAAQALSDAVEKADADAARDLRDALRQGDVAGAQDAVDRMRDRMGQQAEAERERAARELERAAERASDAALQEALRQEAAGVRGGGAGAAQQGGQQGGQQRAQAGPQGGQQQAQAGQQGGQQQAQAGPQGGQQQAQAQQQGAQQGSAGTPRSGGGLNGYLQQLKEQGIDPRALAEQERRQRAAQDLEQALSGSCQRMGQGRGASGGPRAVRPGQGGHAREGTNWGAGSGHTDADQGSHSTAGAPHQDMDRQVENRTSSWVVPFEQSHEAERLQGIQAVATTVDVPLGQGPVDVETLRLGGSDERSAAPLLTLPPSYREAAEEAVDGEAVPRAYREQVRTYFDGMK